MAAWSIADIPSQSGRLAVVTGTGGLGYETALALAGARARVVLAGRSAAKGEASIARILTAHPGADVRFELLDLGDLASVAAAAQRIAARDERIDVLINNAGVMTPPDRRTTADGFELQFGTNYLGHFALTAHLLPVLARSRARVVHVSSGADHFGRIDFDDLQAERRYRPGAAYSQSKLANSIFALELQRRSDAHGWHLTSVAAHPGYARTDLIANGPGKPHPIAAFIGTFASQSAAAGALPMLYAATMPNIRGGDYVGPDGFLALIGAPKLVAFPKRARDAAVAQRLWTLSETLARVHFGLADSGALTTR